MNTALRTAVLAAPLATAALVLGAPAALATTPPHPGHCGPGGFDSPHLPPVPVAPTDEAAGADSERRHCGPGGHEDPDPECPFPTHACDDKDGPKDDPDDEPEDEPKDEPKDEPEDAPKDAPEDRPKTDDDIPVPTRIDTGAGGTKKVKGDGDLELNWILAGGALITVSGAAFAGRALARGRS